MIVGFVNANREAKIRVVVGGAGGQEQEIEAILDTGFTGSLTLPADIIAALRLPWRSRGSVILANGAEDECDIYTAIVIWNGRPRPILVEAADTDPLLGMRLLSGHDVHLQVVEGGRVVIEELP